MKFEKTYVTGFEQAFRGMRNPMNSWDKSDSKCVWPGDVEGEDNIYGCHYLIGKNDMMLAQRLISAGTEHRKFLRQIQTWVDITAPLYWWKEFDTYKVGTTANSTSFMHKGLSKEFDINDFENDLHIDTLYGGNKGREVPIDNIKENWVDIRGYESLYKISNTCRVIRKEFSIIDRCAKVRTYSEKELKPSINSSGYKKVVLRKNGVGENEYLHRLLAIHFIDNINKLPEVNHIDGNKLNCNISNLEWVDKSNNSKHAFDNKLRYITGYNKTILGNNTRRFSEDDVTEILTYYNDGWTQKEIADYMGCFDSVINNIINGKSYNTPECEVVDDWKYIINRLNKLRNEYLKIKDINIWRQVLQILPESWLQTRTISLNYENIRTMYKQRKNHKLIEWSKYFVDWTESLPYFNELIAYEKAGD